MSAATGAGSVIGRGVGERRRGARAGRPGCGGRARRRWARRTARSRSPVRSVTGCRDPRQAVGVEAAQRRVGERAVALAREERRGRAPGGGPTPSSPATCAEERLGGAGRAALGVERPLRVRGDARGTRRRVSVARPARTAARRRRRRRRGPGRRAAASSAEHAAEADPDDARRGRCPGRRGRREIVDVEVDVERARLGEAADVPPPRRSMAWTVRSPGPARRAAEAVELLRGAQRPVEQEHVPRPGPGRPASRWRRRPGRASSPAGSPATSARTASRRSLPPAVRGRASSRVHAAGTLNPARRRAGMGGEGLVAGVGGAVRGARSRRPARGPSAASGRATTAASATAGCARATASTSAGVDVLAAAHDPVRPPVDDDEAARRRRAARGRRSGPARRAVRPAARRGTREPATARRRRSRRRRPASGSSIARSPRGAGVPADPGASHASADGSAVTPEPISDRPYVGTTGQPARDGPIDERGRDRPAAEQDGAGARQAAPTSRAASSSRASWAGTSETWLGAGLDRSGAGAARGVVAGGRTRIGTPSRIARHDDRRARPRARGPAAAPSRSPAAGPRATRRRWRPSRGGDSTTPFGRPVVPEVRTTTAASSGPGLRRRRPGRAPWRERRRRPPRSPGRAAPSADVALPGREPGGEGRTRRRPPGACRRPPRWPRPTPASASGDAIARAHAARVHRAAMASAARGSSRRPRHHAADRRRTARSSGRVAREPSPRGRRSDHVMRRRPAYRSSAASSTATPSPPAPAANGARIRPPSMTSGLAAGGRAPGRPPSPARGPAPRRASRARRAAPRRRRSPPPARPRLEQRRDHDRDAVPRPRPTRSRRPPPARRPAPA